MYKVHYHIIFRRGGGKSLIFNILHIFSLLFEMFFKSCSEFNPNNLRQISGVFHAKTEFLIITVAFLYAKESGKQTSRAESTTS